MTVTQRIRDWCMFSPLPELAIMAIITLALVTSRASANTDTDRIVIISRVNSQVSIQQLHGWVTVQGYYEINSDNAYLTLNVTPAANADDPLIPWYTCWNNNGGTINPVEQDPEYDDEQMSAWDFNCFPTDTAWFFMLTLWVDGQPVDHYYFFCGVGSYRP